MSKDRSVCALALVCLLAVPTLLSAQKAPVLKTFTNTRGYTVQYPSSWRREGLQDLFWIWNFPASRAVRGEILPDGGAGIKILVPSQAVHNLKHNPSNMEEWVVVGTGTKTVVGKRAIELDDGQRRLAVIEVESLCCVSPPYQVSVELVLRSW